MGGNDHYMGDPLDLVNFYYVFYEFLGLERDRDPGHLGEIVLKGVVFLVESYINNFQILLVFRVDLLVEFLQDGGEELAGR